MSLDGAITNLASWAGNTMMPTMAGMFFAGRCTATARAALSSTFCTEDSPRCCVPGMLADPRRLRAARGSDECRRILDGDDESGQLDSQRDPAHVRADTACSDGHAHGRSGFRDLSRLDVDQEVCRGHCGALTVSGMVRLAESMVTQAHGVGG